MSLFCWTQRKIFWRIWETEPFWGTIDFHVFFFLLWKSMVSQNSLVTNLLTNIFLCVRQNKDIHTGWNHLRVSKWRQNLHFWVNYSFNSMGKNIVQNIFCVPQKKYDCNFCVKFHANSLKAHIHFDMDWTCNPLVRSHKNTQWWTLYEQQS